jgi:hypothetical protein
MRTANRKTIARATNPVVWALAASIFSPLISKADNGMDMTAIYDPSGMPVTGGNGTDPSGDGGNATAYSDPTATSPTPAWAIGGTGDSMSGSGGDATAIGTGDLTAAGGMGGGGGSGGDASAMSVTTGYNFTIDSTTYIMSSAYGSNLGGGPPGYPGITVSGGQGGGSVDGTGGSGGNIAAQGVAVGTADSGGTTSLGMDLTGGDGGGSTYGSGGAGGGVTGSVSGTASSQWGGDVSVYMSVSGGNGGSTGAPDTSEGGPGGNGTSIDLENAVSGFSSDSNDSIDQGSPAGRVSLTERAFGGQGGGSPNQGGSGGSATARITTSLPAGAPSYDETNLVVATYAQGGSGGPGGMGATSGSGGAAVAYTSLDDAPNNVADATAYGGTGGGAAVMGAMGAPQLRLPLRKAITAPLQTRLPSVARAAPQAVAQAALPAAAPPTQPLSRLP